MLVSAKHCTQQHPPPPSSSVSTVGGLDSLDYEPDLHRSHHKVNLYGITACNMHVACSRQDLRIWTRLKSGTPGLLVRSGIGPLLAQALSQGLDAPVGVVQHPTLVHRVCKSGFLQGVPVDWQRQQYLRHRNVALHPLHQ